MKALLYVFVCFFNATAALAAAVETSFPAAGVASNAETSSPHLRGAEAEEVSAVAEEVPEEEERVLSENEEELRLRTLAIQEKMQQEERERRELREAAEAARNELSEEEVREAEAEANEALAGIQRALSVTTTTTRAPGFFKEFGRGVVNFFAAPFRNTHMALTKPDVVLDASKGSVSLTKRKVQNALQHKGKWGDVFRDLWRAYTMDPERLKETQRLAAEEYLQNQLPRVALKEGSQQAEELMQLKLKAGEEMRNAFQKAESEAEEQRRFEQLLENSH